METNLKIRATGKFGNKGERYEVLLDGEIIAAGVSPEMTACRVLEERGITGSALFWRDGKTTWDLRMPIAWGAKRTVVENNKIGPRFGKWAPNPLFGESAVSD